MQQKVTRVEKRKKRGQKWFDRYVTRLNDKRLPSRAMHCHVDGIRSKERQPKRWTDNIQKEVKAYNVEMRTALDLARDRER